MDPLKDNQEGAANGGTAPITEAEATEKAIAEAKANAEAAEAQEKAAAEAAGKAAPKNAAKTPAPKKKIAINFVIKKFNLDGVIYESSEVEAAAKAGDVAALKLIEHLVEIKSGVIEIVNQ